MQRAFFAAGLLALSLVTSPAFADRYPASSAVAFDPHDSKTVYARTTFGLLATHDGGDSWRWVCNKALGATAMEDPVYTVTPKGTLVAAASSGISTSKNGGCSFEFPDGPGAHVAVDVVARADGQLFAVQSKPKGSEFDNQILVSKDDGASFTAGSGPIDSKVSLGSLQLSPSDPARVYVSAARGTAASMLVSYDAMMSWVERKVDLADGETGINVAAVDPKNADRVYVRTLAAADHSGRLLLTDDGGKTWKKIYEAGTPLAAVVVADDDSKVFTGSREGIVSSATDNFSFAKGATDEIQCLGLSGKVLWACSTERSGYFLGTSRGGGRGFDAKLHITEIKGVLDCAPETTVAKACTDEWPKMRRELGLPEPGDKPANAAPAGPALKGRGVRTVRSRSTFQTFAGIALVGMIAYYALKRLRRNRF